MRLCLSCRYLSPNDSIHCCRCGRTFGGRLCGSRHISPYEAAFCVRCGKGDLTEPARYVELRWLARLVVWIAVCVLIHLVATHTGSVLLGTETIAAWLLLHIFGLASTGINCLVQRLFGWFFALMFFSLFLPKSARRAVRAGVIKYAVAVATVFVTVLRMGGIWLYGVVEGRRNREADPRAR